MRLLLLAYHHPRYTGPLTGWARRLRRRGFAVAERYPATTYREEAARELGGDYDLVLYFGHGTPLGWSGYRRLRARDLAPARVRKPGKLIMSLSCYALTSPGRGRSSFARALLTRLSANGVVGYEGAVRYQDNAAFLERFLSALCAHGPHGLGAFVRRHLAGERRSSQLPLKAIWRGGRAVHHAAHEARPLVVDRRDTSEARRS